MRSSLFLLSLALNLLACGAPPGGAPDRDADAAIDAAPDAAIDAAPDAAIDGPPVPTRRSEEEPNDDGWPSVTADASVVLGYNDIDESAFDRADDHSAFPISQGPVVIDAALAPAGDEDLFAIVNDTGLPFEVKATAFSRRPGAELPDARCIDAGSQQVLHLLSRRGTQLDFDRTLGNAWCGALRFYLRPGQTLYVLNHAFQDNREDLYKLALDYTPAACGDGIQVPAGEQCDDGNLLDGDGCDNRCFLEDASFEHEPNDGVDGAEPVSIPSRTVAAMTARDLVDHFAFTMPEAGVIRLETATGLFPLGCDESLGLRIRRVDSGVPVAFATDAHRCNGLVAYLPPGDYVAEVTPDEQTGAGFYVLDTALPEDRGAEAEAPEVAGGNDTPATAESALLDAKDAWIAGAFASGADVDVYAITVPAGHAIRAEAFGAGPDPVCEEHLLATHLTLLDAKGEVLTGDLSNGRGTCALIDGGINGLHLQARNPAASAQTFFLAMRPAPNLAPIGYRLQVSTRPID